MVYAQPVFGHANENKMPRNHCRMRDSEEINEMRLFVVTCQICNK